MSKKQRDIEKEERRRRRRDDDGRDRNRRTVKRERSASPRREKPAAPLHEISDIRSLIEVVEGHKLGFEFITEIGRYKKTETRVKETRPLYRCDICCMPDGFYARANTMLEHLKTQTHNRNFFRKKFDRDLSDTEELFDEVEAEWKTSGLQLDRMSSIVSLQEWRTGQVKLCRKMQELPLHKIVKRPRAEEQGDNGEDGHNFFPTLPPGLKNQIRESTEQDELADPNAPDHDDIAAPAQDQIGDQMDTKPAMAAATDNGDLLAVVSANAPNPKPFKHFHIQVAEQVKRFLYKYFSSEAEGYVKKIATREDFGILAKTLSHKYRAEEKESFVACGGKVEEIEMNPDMSDRIRVRIEMVMEEQPVLPEN